MDERDRLKQQHLKGVEKCHGLLLTASYASSRSSCSKVAAAQPSTAGTTRMTRPAMLRSATKRKHGSLIAVIIHFCFRLTLEMCCFIQPRPSSLSVNGCTVHLMNDLFVKRNLYEEKLINKTNKKVCVEQVDEEKGLVHSLV